MSTPTATLNGFVIEELPDKQIVFVDNSNNIIHSIEYDPLKSIDKRIIIEEILEGLNTISQQN